MSEGEARRVNPGTTNVEANPDTRVFDLDTALRAMPRHEASPDFTSRVVDAARDGQATVPNEGDGSWLRAAAAVFVLCGGALLAGWLWSGGPGLGSPDGNGDVAAVGGDATTPESAPGVASQALDQFGGASPQMAAHEVETLRSQFYSLQAELEELKRLAKLADPVVDLGSSGLGASPDPVDYLLDLRAVPTLVPRGSSRPQAVRTRF